MTVKAGEERREFFLHEGLICHLSAFFRRAFRGDTPAKSTCIILEELDPTIFDTFKTWLYTGRFFKQAITPETTKKQANDKETMLEKASACNIMQDNMMKVKKIRLKW